LTQQRIGNYAKFIVYEADAGDLSPNYPNFTADRSFSGTRFHHPAAVYKLSFTGQTGNGDHLEIRDIYKTLL